MVGAQPAILLLALAPWVLLAWPAWAIARELAAAYRAKRFSDLWYLMAAYWLVVLAAGGVFDSPHTYAAITRIWSAESVDLNDGIGVGPPA